MKAKQGMFGKKQMDCQIHGLTLGQNCMRNPKIALIFDIEQPRLVKNDTESLVSTITEPDTKIRGKIMYCEHPVE